MQHPTSQASKDSTTDQILFAGNEDLYVFEAATKETPKSTMADRKINSDVPIICRAAGVDSACELWDVLAQSKDVNRKITRFNTDGFYHHDGGPRK